MKIKASLLAGLIASAPFAFGQEIEVATDPVGYVSVNLTAASDTRIATPVTRAPEFQGIPESVSGSSITFAAGTGLQLTESAYFVAVRDGTLAGLRATVVGTEDGGDTLVLEDGTDLTGLATGEGGDPVQLIPHWTLTSLFPADLPNETQVQVFDRNVEAGVNLAPSQIFTIFDGEWFDEDFAPADDTVVQVDESVVVRDSSGGDVTMTIAGSVPMFPLRETLSTLQADTAQDTAIGFAIPADFSVGALSGAQNNDELHLPSNDETGINKAPREILVFFDGQWFDEDFAPADSRVLEPGEGFVYRKAGTAEAQSDSLTFTPAYLTN